MSADSRWTGDPCKRRFKVMRCHTRRSGARWRVFELAQPGQSISKYEDLYFLEWHRAMNYANACAAAARNACEMRKKWPNTSVA